MERFGQGEIVAVLFPFSDLSSAKRRPALVLATLSGDDIILCQITSSARFDEYSIGLTDDDFSAGKLPVRSFIRPNRIFTADKKLISARAGAVKLEKFEEVRAMLRNIFSF